MRGENYPVVMGSSYTSAILVNADECTIEGLTITGGITGIIVFGNNTLIRDNIVTFNSYGIYLTSVIDNTIAENTITSNYYGVYTELSGLNTISNNYIQNNALGVWIDASYENQIERNLILNNQNEGILISFSDSNIISENKIVSNNRGIYLYGATFNTINNNLIKSNSQGITLKSYVPQEGYAPEDPFGNRTANETPYDLTSTFYTQDNIIYLNDFVDNGYENKPLIFEPEDIGNTNWNSIDSISYTYNGSQFVGKMGNYWNPMDVSEPDANGDGILDFDPGYLLYGDAQENIWIFDYYPLASNQETYFGETYNIPPQPDFTYTPTNPYVNVEVEFNAGDYSSDPDGYIASYEWEFGDGSTGNGNLAWHTYTTPGKYTVKLTVTDNNGTSNSIAKVINVQPPDTTPPSLQITWPYDGYITSKNWVTVTVYADEELGEATLHFDSSNYPMNIAGKTASYNVTGLSEGDHSFFVSAEDLSGNPAQTDTYTITVDLTPPSVSFESPTPENGAEVNRSWVYVSISANEELSLATLDWNGTSLTMMGSGNTRYYNVTGLVYGNYTYKVYATDKAGNQGETEERTVFVNITVYSEIPVADFSYSPASPEVGENVTFTDESYDPDGTIVTWSWDFGDGETANVTNPVHSYSSAGNYTVRLTVTDNSGDSNYTTKIIQVKEPESEDTGGDNTRGVQGRVAGGGGGGGGGLPPPVEGAQPTPTPTKLRTPASIPWIPPKKTPKPSAPSLPGAPSEKTETPKRPKTPEPFKGPKGLLPGFEAVFAIAGLLAVAYLIRRGKI